MPAQRGSRSQLAASSAAVSVWSPCLYVLIVSSVIGAFFSALRPDLHVPRCSAVLPRRSPQKIGVPSPGQKRGRRATVDGMTTTANGGLDTLVLGRRIRHLRTGRNMTLDDLGAAIGRAPSQVSMLENGHREPKLSLLAQVAEALDVPLAELLRTEPPTRRAALEVELERAQRGPLFASLGVPPGQGRPVAARPTRSRRWSGCRPRSSACSPRTPRPRRRPAAPTPSCGAGCARRTTTSPSSRSTRARCSPRSTTPAARCPSAGPRTSPRTSASACTT